MFPHQCAVAMAPCNEAHTRHKPLLLSFGQGLFEAPVLVFSQPSPKKWGGTGGTRSSQFGTKWGQNEGEGKLKLSRGKGMGPKFLAKREQTFLNFMLIKI